MRVFAWLLTAVLALSLAGTAYAGSNIKQKDTGATVWEDDTGLESPVGDSGLMVEMTTLSTASTEYTVSHKSGRLVRAYIVTTSEGTGTASVIDFGIMNSTTDGWFDPVTGIAATSLGTITVSDGTGVVSNVAFTDVDNDVDAGDVIAIHTDGASTAGSSDVAQIILFIE